DLSSCTGRGRGHMAITVQELVNLPIFNMAKVVSGIEFLDKRKVEWVSAIEGPVENFVRKEELIVTTGMGCEHHPELFFEFVKEDRKSTRLNSSHVSISYAVFCLKKKKITCDVSYESMSGHR